jgi:glucose/arabinose dehydrogenase
MSPSAHVVPGAPAGSPDLTWLKLPAGFCAHYFGNVPDARQLRFAPGGELFVASPTTPTTGGNTNLALAAIVVLPDDDHDGIADQNITFLSNLPSTQGLLFANGAFYYQDDATIRSVAYKINDRMPSALSQVVTTITAPQDGLHWPKVMDIATDGTIYITNGGSQGDQCLPGDPVRGAVFKLDPSGSTTLVAKGFRNPISLRCESNHNVCVATELALDYSDSHGGREKVVPIRAGDDWGHPCCATQDLAYAGMTYPDGGTPECTGIAADTDSFVIGHTPFGVDFETGKWPAPWTGRAFVTLHGKAGNWEGARLVSLGVDPTTGALQPGTELGADAGTLLEFASGWDDGSRTHGRPRAHHVRGRRAHVPRQRQRRHHRVDRAGRPDAELTRHDLPLALRRRLRPPAGRRRPLDLRRPRLQGVSHATRRCGGGLDRHFAAPAPPRIDERGFPRRARRSSSTPLAGSPTHLAERAGTAQRRSFSFQVGYRRPVTRPRARKTKLVRRRRSQSEECRGPRERCVRAAEGQSGRRTAGARHESRSLRNGHGVAHRWADSERRDARPD